MCGPKLPRQFVSITLLQVSFIIVQAYSLNWVKPGVGNIAVGVYNAAWGRQ
jgi:hypothetical protein